MNNHIDVTLLEETKLGRRCRISTPSRAELEEISTLPLSEFTFSSLVTSGPDAKQLHRVLEKINSACINNDPKTVMDICDWILKNGYSYYMKATTIEVILTYSRAYTLFYPEESFLPFYSFLCKLFFVNDSTKVIEVN